MVFMEETTIFSNHQYHTGDWVIYRKQKSSTTPGPRAENVHAAQKGNLYRYTVDKFWVVEGLGDNGQLLLRTRRGKRHSVAPDDPALRKAKVWERWIYRNRFEGSDLSSADVLATESTATKPTDSGDSATEDRSPTVNPVAGESSRT